ncbi:ParA family protein [Streptomyces salyersiae]|uniref:ParA family protein n=1 Tax=Streptomyces salyersiae TaxID=3075530 RepID=A0ABU2RVN7_9ACTN|nr:ParA family protein [Streptomyces sp. DSM 41770]MDT0432907.1 ParA family protein [Streptomyces sp. DSM 41770]
MTGAGTRVASYSEKGGVGKSALAAGLTAVARKRSLNGTVGTVYGGDLDPRGTFSAELGLETGDLPASMNDLLALDPKGENGLAADVVLEASESWSGVRVLAAERALANRETDMATGLEFRLRSGLHGLMTADDVGVLDLPPRAGGRLVVSGLVAATHVVIPATLDEDGRIGAREALDTIRQVQETYNPDLQIVGIVPSIVPGGASTLGDAIGKFLADTYGSLYRDDLTIPRHAVRQQTRFARVPITSQTTREASALTKAYGRILTAAGVAE